MKFIEEIYGQILHARRIESIDAGELLSEILRDEISKIHQENDAISQMSLEIDKQIVRELILKANEIYNRKNGKK